MQYFCDHSYTPDAVSPKPTGHYSSYISKSPRRAFLAAAFLSLALASFVSNANAQTDASPSDDLKPVPVFSAGMGFVTQFQGGQPNLDPLVSPIFLIPLGDHWLIESRDTFESDFTQPPGSSSFHGQIQKEVDYLQLDCIANPYLTVTVGRYLTPFGIFNERLYPIWIRDLQSDPLILPIATGPSGAGTGAMLRGGFPLSGKANLNYAAYFSALSRVSPVDSNRVAGGRAGLFFPDLRLEVGGSFQHLLESDHSNPFGFHFEWQPPRLPLDLRSEYAHSTRGSGYWLESAYRLSQISKAQDQFRRIQLVARMQQFFLSSYSNSYYGWPSAASTGWNLPSANTQEFEFGLNYYLRDDLRAVSSYGRQFSSAGSENVWTLGLTYRFAVPVGRGEGN